MRVTFRQLQVFEAVARHMNLTRAAEELHLSQPAVSMQVKQLEGAAGLPLLEQIGKQNHLTEAGSVMAHYSRVIAAELREAEQALEDLKGIEGGRLRISVATTVNYFATGLLSEFCRAHEKIRISLDVTNRQSLLRQLEDNSTDLVLMGRPPDGLDVIATPFMDNPLVVIASPAHPLVSKRKVPLASLERETFLTREPGSGTRMAMQRFFDDHGIRPSSSIEMTSNEAIKQSVEAGLGLGIVSIHTVELELDAGRLVVLDARFFPIRRKWYVVHRKGKRLSAATEAFRDFVLAAARRAQKRSGIPARKRWQAQ